MRVLGLANHSPDFISILLKKHFNVSPADVRFVGPSDILNKSSSKKFFVFLSSRALRINQATINSNKYRTKTGFVCDSPIALYDLDGIVPLDYFESENLHLDAFEITEVNKDRVNGPDTTIGHTRKKYAEVVQAKIESFTGILTQYMTFIYTMPSSSHQKPIKELACTWWASDETEDTLSERLASLVKGVPLSEKQQKRFFDLLLSPSALIYKAALSEVKDLESYDGEEFTSIAAKYGVSAYEMRYILSIRKMVANR